MMRCEICGAARVPDAGPCPHDDSADPRLGAMVGNFRLTSVLGRGGMGTVYRGDHTYLSRAVAVKILHDELLANSGHTTQFLREAQAASQIRHPNIVEVLDFGEMDGGGVYFLMELLDGVPLDEVISDSSPLPALQAINIMNQIARALDAVHACGILHGDLKPENVVLTRRDSNRLIVRRVQENSGQREVIEPEGAFDFVKLLDFGTSRLIATAHQEGLGIVGTPWYMAPEIILSKPHDLRVDVYAAGVMLYEMMTGNLPFDGESPQAVMQQHVHCEPIAPRNLVTGIQREEITDEMERTILTAMAKKPEDRFPSMESFRRALGACYGATRYTDPGPEVREERATAESMRRPAVVNSTQLSNAAVEDKLSSLFGAWAERLAAKRRDDRDDGEQLPRGSREIAAVAPPQQALPKPRNSSSSIAIPAEVVAARHPKAATLPGRVAPHDPPPARPTGDRAVRTILPREIGGKK